VHSGIEHRRRLGPGATAALLAEVRSIPGSVTQNFTVLIQLFNAYEKRNLWEPILATNSYEPWWRPLPGLLVGPFARASGDTGIGSEALLKGGALVPFAPSIP
jgi:hypothetical protein